MSGDIIPMRRVTGGLVALLFFVWILPLGVFIKPSQEKKVCGGQRAMCMCSNLMVKQTAPDSAGATREIQEEARSTSPARQIIRDSGKTIYKAGSEVPNNANGPSSANQDFLLIHGGNNSSIKIAAHFSQQFAPYPHIFVRTVEHVPKV